MRLPGVRFTVRRMMVAVAVVALALSGCIWLDRMSRLMVVYQRRALEYELSAVRWGSDRAWKGPGKRPPKTEHDRWALELANKYSNAACYPWLPVPPDPPEPK